MEIRVLSITGEVMMSARVSESGVFEMGPREIIPDAYVLCLGTTEQPIYLSNQEVTIKGFYDERNPEKSTLSFTGIDDYLSLAKWIPQELNPQKKIVDPAVKSGLSSSFYGALAYLSKMETYEANKILLDLIPEKERVSRSVKWLVHRVDSLKKYALGEQAYDFQFQDPAGKRVRLSDFRGKYVLIDFWASWCGPCRQEMKSLLPIYNELKADDLEFISISLDSQETDWRKMLNEEELPWVMLWDENGFVKGNESNGIQRAYGFYSIPFIVLIDKEGRFLARGLRGEQVKEAILKARQE